MSQTNEELEQRIDALEGRKRIELEQAIADAKRERHAREIAEYALAKAAQRFALGDMEGVRKLLCDKGGREEANRLYEAWLERRRKL